MESLVQHTALEQYHVDSDWDSRLSTLNDRPYSLPAMPKLSIIININAAILVAILTVVFTVMNHHKLIETIITFSNLMLCFTFGAIVAILSCLFDYKARAIYSVGAPKKRLLADVAEIYDVCAFMIFAASLMIFVWGSYLTFYLVRGAFF
jgi:hypothetical protein